MSNDKEARLMRSLATELDELHALEQFRLVRPDNDNPIGYHLFEAVEVSFATPYFENSPTSLGVMRSAISQMIAENAAELVASAIARQRATVDAARDRLKDFQALPVTQRSDDEMSVDKAQAAEPSDTELARAQGGADPLHGERMDSADMGEERQLQDADELF